MATRNGVIPGSAGLAQAHPLTKPPAMRKQPAAGLGPVTVHPTPYPFGRWSSDTYFFARAFYYLRILFFSSSPCVSYSSRRNSDPGSLNRLFSLLPTMVRAFVFIARRLQPFIPLSTSIEVCVPTRSQVLSAVSSSFDFLFLQTSKKNPNHVGFEPNKWTHQIHFTVL